MPSLPVISGHEVVRALRRGGFEVVRQRGSHTTLRHPQTLRSVTVAIHASRGIPVGTLRGIIADAGLSVDEFRRLAE